MGMSSKTMFRIRVASVETSDHYIFIFPALSSQDPSLHFKLGYSLYKSR